MKCLNCGELINENESFCGNCGNVVKKENDISDNINNVETTQSISTNEIVSNKQPKKNNSSKILIIVSILLLIVLLIVGIIYFINKDKDLKNNDNQNIEEKDNKNGNSSDENKKDNENIGSNYVLADNIKQKLSPITTTSIVLNFEKNDYFNIDETFDLELKVDSNKNLIANCSNNKCNNEVINLNGEKAKYIDYSGPSYGSYMVIVLTEEGNFYYSSVSSNNHNFTKIDSKYRFVNFYNSEIYLESSLQGRQGGRGGSPYYLVGITSDDKYVTVFSQTELVQQKSKLIVSTLNDNSIYIYIDGKVRYNNLENSSEKYNSCINKNTNNNSSDILNNGITQKCTQEMLDYESYIVDEKSNIIYAKMIFNNKNSDIYIISFDNYIYKLTTDKSGENYIAKKYNNSLIKEIKNINSVLENKNSFSSITVSYENGKNENFEVAGWATQIIFEEK